MKCITEPRNEMGARENCTDFGWSNKGLSPRKARTGEDSSKQTARRRQSKSKQQEKKSLIGQQEAKQNEEWRMGEKGK